MHLISAFQGYVCDRFPRLQSYALKQSFSLSQLGTTPARLAGEQSPGSSGSSFPPSVPDAYVFHTWQFPGAGDHNSGLHGSKVSTLTVEASPHARINFLKARFRVSL